MRDSIILATRASALALFQANLVKGLLEQKHPGLKVEILPLKTSGDLILDRPLREVGGKALFVKEIEEALLQKKADFAVHSMKDVPALLPQGLKLGVILEREDASDVLICRNEGKLENLPPAAKVGSSSLRRKIQLLRLRPDLKVVDLRGNIDTRLRKLKEGALDAILLAAAGLKRLGLFQTHFQRLDFIASPGQGAIGLEYRECDRELQNILQVLDHPQTHVCVEAERLLMRHFEASCELPLGAHAFLKGNGLSLKAFVSNQDGSRYLEAEKEGELVQALLMAQALVDELKAQGAEEFFKV
ncbi:MAG: hydroxymethylbilane synthase [Deltaproteobacteria bacterium]|nr:hydroxymethylbilane synthase [Deltaproteobacteria bacterium]